jgi:glycine/serine hydroxymethyltransferase
MKDVQIKKLIDTEKKRQKSVINLIASENYVSKDVLEALGSELTNKYAEGYPGARYYGGNEIVDKVESIAIERALKLFKLLPEKWHVNVQALSGSPANLAVYLALAPLGGKVMGMSLDHGGHLTHGHKVSMTGKAWVQVPYGVNKDTEMIDYEEIKKIAQKEKPNIIVAGFTAYPRKVDFKKFREIADSCGAILMAEGLRLGYALTGLIVAAIIAVTAIAWRLRLNSVLSFWIIYIMTRPLGVLMFDGGEDDGVIAKAVIRVGFCLFGLLVGGLLIAVVLRM